MDEIPFDELNKMEPETFIDYLTPILQGERWLPERVVDNRPFGSVRMLHKALFNEVMDAGDRKRCDLIIAHDGVLPQEGDAPPVPATEEAEEIPSQSWPSLRSQYRGNFGFDFVLARPPEDEAKLLGALLARMNNTEKDERLLALREISEMTFERLEDAFRVAEPDTQHAEQAGDTENDEES
ncbi:2-oxo-4-hydroxy-4-carboxy-5-ureidoimidazoline decarboxylase [Ahrensia sp. R2A130]|uniref:2-oxo-4-hydroxy-4-carboxy-5-ureidoimidazoline decarboxylase n=1 Tax=Ahrensia sp. R2A130 TaxID=744979 RepID=UPI0001E0E0BE|nr:2-oxo-4-hydroxy-4-carboxy-5-ureidoimidazoline decarboxylase [Ahrensia sp. R2A130]EFL88918.1 putative uricase [Ahrensia sp. R2A130]